MQRIIVKNFGPLKDIDLEIKDYMVFLGPQASGKSTLAKLIYDFKQIIYNSFTEHSLWKNKIDENFTIKFIPEEWEFFFRKFFFPTLKNYKNYSITYFYENDITVNLTEINDFIKVKFNDKFFESISTIETEINDIVRIEAVDLSQFLKEQTLQYSIRFKIREKISVLFTNNTNMGLLYIPDKRDINTPQSSIFLNNGTAYREYFTDGFSSLKKNIKNTANFFDEKRFNIIKYYFTKILKGEFQNIGEGKISLLNGIKVSLDLASSGQKEVIGILLILSVEILKKSRDFYVIEEPEAHLFPEAQKDITYLISLLANQEGNQVIITTHSHYILGALNILINAHRIGQTNPEEVEKIIPRELWVDKNRIFAGFLENGEIKNIYDDDAEMIKIQQLNAVAGEINKDFDKLLDLEFANEEIN